MTRSLSGRALRYSACAIVASSALALSACSSGGGGANAGPKNNQAQAQQSEKKYSTTKVGTAADSNGPATPVPGAKNGGVLQTYEESDIGHYDPGQIYTANAQDIVSLFERGLTGYKMSNDGTKFTVVGDLATDPGTASNGDKTWTFHLKSGLKWQDGTPITATDIKWSFERLFDSGETNGPTYMQQWLSNTTGAGFRKFYPGPYKGKSLPDSVLSAPDNSTIVFNFKTPHADLPYTLAMPGYGAVEKAKDTKAKYDQMPVSDGPYQIKSHSLDKELVLEKNPNWDPKLDPIRHQYLDGYDIHYGHSTQDTTQRLEDQTGANAKAVSLGNPVDPNSADKVLTTPSIAKYTVQGYEPFNGTITYNMTRLKDYQVRKALSIAMPIKQILTAAGGASAGDLAGNYFSPTMAGWKQTDPYGKLKKPNGDPATAKAMLTKLHKTGMKVTLAYENTPAMQNAAAAIQTTLKQAGVNVQLKDIPRSTYFTQIDVVPNQYDMYMADWGADWPNGDTVIPPLFDGRQIATGANNTAHLNDPYVNKQIDKINAMTDVNQSQTAWQNLGEYILEKDLPGIPTYNWTQVQLYGKDVGGVVYNNVLAMLDPTRLFLK
ncbi:hypothetical protein BIV57_11505 [Mangrovactinospora gilvigrisea]|uniref:Solute-binding protein family 5 domain-containing protein n=1 Tax=Mangrovactinospora gilvigrisea TaxID=1428644 RepID=A0A1J7BV53_9ACTN|nr:ABC transporter substrate-binding protein [Mangrovactinospora gilvigrisea]OIV37361.1 hypothetical protein BIV57_11505 [Mangrovactinospora gilvigrisea]